MIEIAHLLALADEYQRICPMADATLSTLLFNDGKKLTALKADKDLHTKRFNISVQWFSDHWPDGAVWPEGIARPQKVAA